MAVSDSIQRLVTRVRRRSQVDSKEGGTLKDKAQQADGQYEPSPGPATDQASYYPPPLRQVHLPLVLPEHQYNLAVQGWTTVSFPSKTAIPEEQARADAIRSSVASIFAAGRDFFDKSAEYKSQFLTKQGSEDGWNAIPGEKEFITIRSLSRVPIEVRDAAIQAWSVFGELINESLVKVAESLALEPEALVRFSRPCSMLKDTETATMLRIFRYETWEDKVVAEAHNDLGLLSLVVGNSPGLEVWSPMIRQFYPIEKSYTNLDEMGTVLVGRQLQRLSNGRYIPGGHRVMSYPKKDVKGSAEKKYRYSVVFVLRAHYDEIIDVKSLCGPITGTNTMVKDGESARQFFANIRSSYYNINTGVEERKKQKEHINKRRQVANGQNESVNGVKRDEQEETTNNADRKDTRA